MIRELFIAGAGGFAGTAARFLVGRFTSTFWVGAFPMGTFLANAAGCLLIGLFIGLIERMNIVTSWQGLLLVTGFCGGFTTFSAFANEIYVMTRSGHWGLLALYLGLSVVLGVALVWLGRKIAA